jgi:hypothetical protein
MGLWPAPGGPKGGRGQLERRDSRPRSVPLPGDKGARGRLSRGDPRLSVLRLGSIASSDAAGGANRSWLYWMAPGQAYTDAAPSCALIASRS